MFCSVLCLALLPFAYSTLIGDLLPCPLGYKCCPDGEKYYLGPPWDTPERVAFPPRCLENPAKYLLSNRSNPQYPVVFSQTNFSQIQGYCDASKPWAIVFHGYGQSEDTVLIRNITSAYLTKVDACVIFVDYSNASSSITYFQSVSDIRVAARYVIKAVQKLIEYGTPAFNFHLIGHSLGAQLAAYVAKAIPGIGRLTGLDPAGPGFSGEDCAVRFCKGDADFTEAIHTNGHLLIGYGTSDFDVADVDFLVNGGCDQPGCPIGVYQLSPLQSVFDLINASNVLYLNCSHHRSVHIYTESFVGSCTFWGVKPNGTDVLESLQCNQYPTQYNVTTTDCTLETCVPIGLETINATGRGQYLVQTNSEPPLCVSQS